MKDLIRIESDLFDIADRLKEIDAGYELYFNTLKNRYEVFARGVLQVAVPFGKLDARTLLHVRSTRLERADELLKQIDWQNKRAEELAAKTALKKCADAANL